MRLISFSLPRGVGRVKSHISWLFVDSRPVSLGKIFTLKAFSSGNSKFSLSGVVLAHGSMQISSISLAINKL